MRRFLLLAWLISCVVPPAWSQSPNTPWLPVGLNGETGPLSALGEGSEDTLTAGVTLASVYNSNGYSNNSSPVGDVSYSITPNISITESRPRIVWALQYGAGFTQSQHTGDQLSQNLYFNLQYRISEKLTLQLGDRFFKTNTWFAGLNVNPTIPAGNVIQQPNQSVLTPEAIATNNSSQFNLIYQPTDDTVAGVGGSFSLSNFHNVVSGSSQPLFDSTSGTASAYFSHRIHGSSWLGVTYTFGRILTTGQVDERASTQNAQVFYTFAPSPHTSLSLFAGPNYVKSQATIELVIFGVPVPLTVPTSDWGVNAGGTAGWRGELTGVSASYVRRISNGGGLSGAVHSNAANISFNRQLKERWTANASLMYGNNDSVNILYGGSFQTISGVASLNWTPRDNLTAMLSYARDHQASSFTNLGSAATGASNDTIDRNRVWISVSYHFSRPLGW